MSEGASYTGTVYDAVTRCVRQYTSQSTEVFAAHNETCPKFSFLDQGSYAMNTGVKPLDGDFDIDQRLYFEISIDAYPGASSASQCFIMALRFV